MMEKQSRPCGLVTNIQGYTIHDGPGIRTEIFLKGCPLHCPWCSNPEGIDAGPQLGIYPAKCIGLDKCGFCVRDCPQGGAPLQFSGDSLLKAAVMTDQCRTCGICAGSCPSGAVRVWGQKYTVEELMQVIEKDRSFYERTGGGVTVSGGEALLQWEFVRLLLSACREAGIHTCVESALFVPEEHVDAVMEYTDLLITDIKYFDSERHRAVTGVPNGRILENIRRVAKSGIPIVVRTPIVPGWNDDDGNILAIGAFVEELGGSVIAWQLLPYRKMGTEKYEALGIAYPMGDYEAPAREVWEPNLLRIRDLLLERYRVPVAAGSSGKLPEAASKRREAE